MTFLHRISPSAWWNTFTRISNESPHLIWKRQYGWAVFSQDFVQSPNFPLRRYSSSAQHLPFFKPVQCVRAFDVLHGFPGVSPSSSPFLLHASFSPLSLKESSKMGFPPPSHMIHIHTGGRVFPEVKWRGWVGGGVGVQFNISSQNLMSTRILYWVVNLCLRRLKRETRH